MRLKHLELQGYKSFANKTELEFPTGVTAIVGPNGSGKSNVADAIRWALGERSMSTLRAKSTADMIFAGGQSRARAGMAEVSLTFDNLDGGLPIEFSEVTITRRAYRSGENEYLINGSQVLLRDVEELLAESSLSERMYTVVGQGLVDAALSLRPQERRALFEEAAGISLYRDRREKTVERLDETEHNLARVHDIIGEVAPRLERLERDAERVEQHRRLTAHLERLQRTWYGHQWGRQQTELEHALERASNLGAMLEARQRKASQLDEQLNEVRQREAELRVKLRDWYRESADLHDRVDEAQRGVAVSEERERLLKARREELLDEIDPLKAQLREQAEHVAEIEERVDQLERELKERKGRLAEAQQEARNKKQAAGGKEQERARVERELRGHRAQMERLDRALLEAREEASRVVSERAVAEERARQLQSRREEVLAEIESLRERGEAQSEQVARGRARLEELERELTGRKQELATLKQGAGDQARGEGGKGPERDRAEGALQAHRKRVERLDRALRENHRQEAQLAGELRALERVEATRAAYGKGGEDLLRADGDGVLGPLAPLIRVPRAWERAIEAAVGSDLQAVVVRWARERVSHFADEQVGRVVLLPLTVLRVPPALPAGVVSAADVVSCDEGVRPAVHAVLGRVALCDDLEEAWALLPQMPPGSRCVTRAGVVLRADGAVILEQAEDDGLLADQRARRELPEQLEGVRRRCRELEEQRQAAVERIEALEARLEEIDRRAMAAREERTRAFQERLGEARTAVAVAREKLQGQRAALKREETELKRIRSQRGTLSRQMERLEADYAAVAERAEALRMAVSRMEDDAGDRARSVEMEAARGFRARLKEAYRRSRDIEERQRAERERISALEAQLEALSQEVAEAREAAARFEREALSPIRTQVAVAEESLRSRQTALERGRALLERLRSQVDARSQRVGELKVERAALLDRIEGLRREASHLEAKLREVRRQIRPAEEELERLGDRQTTLEGRLQRARERVRDAEARHGRAELDVERCRDELRLLAERIEEDLGLVELELAESVTAQTPLPMRPLVSALPVVEQLPEGLEDEMRFLEKRLRRLGGINPNAPEELAEVEKRHRFLTGQAADLERATARLRQSVAELDQLMERAFGETFEAVAGEFSETFTRLFDGGTAHLALTDHDDLLSAGVEIVAQPPGKRAQPLALLSGGERALTAAALLFSLLHVSSTPFCVLDEVDAMLDETNVARFRARLEELARETQFIVITHNRGTVESADTIYGVSMGSNAVSQIVSLKMDAVRDGG